MMNKIIRVEHVNFSYDKSKEFIKDLNFTIDEGSYTCIIGANGSGKTTISRLISGLLDTDKGDIFIDGIMINGNNINQIRDYVGVIFQNPDNQYVATTLKEDIIFGLENHNVDRDKMDEIINDVANKCHVSELLNKDPSSMSGGQKQKGAIAGILALNPKILILDEASSMLDPISKMELNQLVNDLKKERNLTVVSITHNPNEILLADHIIMIDKGSIVFDGNRGEFFNFDASSYNVELPYIMQLEKELGYREYVDENVFFEKEGEALCK